MNKKFILPIFLLAMISLVVFVSAKMTYSESGSKTSYITEIELKKGWNLVSALDVQGILDGSELKKEDISVVWTYLPQRNRYYQIYPTLDAEFLNAGFDYKYNSFLVYSNKRGIIKYSSSEMSTFVKMPLFSGWNFITIFPEIIGKSLNELKGNCEIANAYLWDAKSQQWGTILNLLDDKNILNNEAGAGAGFIVKVSNDCTLGSGSAQQPPALP